jgi:hypothetical protein
MTRIVIICTTLCTCAPLFALPPVGVTLIDSTPERTAMLSVVDGVAYINSLGGVWNVQPDAHIGFVPVNHPNLGTRSVTTRVVKGPDGHLYLGANFVEDDPNRFVRIGAALFGLDQPTTPRTTWPGELADVRGLDGDLDVFGNLATLISTTAPEIPVQFQVDGTTVELDRPLHPDFEEPIGASVLDVSETGYAVGGANAPGILRVDSVIWTPEGEFSFVAQIVGPHAPAISVRDRNDGNGVNIGFDNVARVVYGTEPLTHLRREEGEFDPGDEFDIHTIVSQSEFAVVNSDVDGVFAYFPGIVSAEPGVALPIEQLFPELTTIDFNEVNDLYAVDGHIFMTLSGPDGLSLFGERDPSLIPEPSAVILIFVAAGVAGFYAWRGRRM